MPARAVDRRAHLLPLHQPAGEPADRVIGNPPRPLEDRAGDRVAGSQLGEDQADRELADEDQTPGPEERRSTKPEAEREQLEDRGEDRDEGEAGAERRERAEAAV